MTESFRTQDGRKLAYRREGSGPLLVCHPGGPGLSSTYLADLGGLGATRTLILFDPRGTAGSDAPDEERAYDTSDYVADVDELREHLGVEQLDLLGHSHGGVVALAYGAAHPKRVRRLIAADSLVRLQRDEEERLKARHSDEPWYEDAQRALEQEDAGEYSSEAELQAIVRRFWPMYFATYDERAAEYIDTYLVGERANPDALKLFNEQIAEWDMRGDLGAIEAPTLVITGEFDFICGPACAEDIAGGIKGAQKVLVEDCGHFTFVEKPDEFRATVEAFLA
jgi:proline-specific peptidase